MYIIFVFLGLIGINLYTFQIIDKKFGYKSVDFSSNNILDPLGLDCQMMDGIRKRIYF
jgi:hypothetical protein